MRIHVASDLHQEFGEADVPTVECDCVILAGDVSIKQSGLKWILQRFQGVPVVYLCGNHEFYGARFPRLIEKLKEQSAGTNVRFLENEFITISGFHIFGCTLWTDMALHGDWCEGAAAAQEMMNDYKRVRNSGRGYKRLTARDTRAAHLNSLAAMSSFFETHDPWKTIVVTHHAPSILSLPKRRQSDLISCAYASHLDSFIHQHQPRLWIHGHIHHNNSYLIGKTRVVSNPRAYPDAPNPQFIPDLVLTVDAEEEDPVACQFAIPPDECDQL